MSRFASLLSFAAALAWGNSSPTPAAAESTPDEVAVDAKAAGDEASKKPAASPTSVAHEPVQVDLTRVRFDDKGAVAPSKDGKPTRLTLDPVLQRAADRLLALASPLEGAVVVVDARTGRVLVWSERTQPKGAPGDVLLSAKAPSASLFKLVTTAALLEHGKVSPSHKVCISGGERRIERHHLEAPKSAPQQCNLFVSALGHSRNAAYAQLVTRHLMHGDLLSTAERMGLNAPVPFDANVLAGRVEVPYGDLDFARTAAGFGNVTLSPLGALQLAATVASGGQRQAFRIVESADASSPASERALDPATANVMRRMMEVTVHSGTSLDVFSSKSGQSHLGAVRVAGKTGTLKPSASAPTTTWFVGFAPSRSPQVLVSVMLANGPVWRQKANEVARDMLRVHFARAGVRGVTDPLQPARAPSKSEQVSALQRPSP